MMAKKNKIYRRKDPCTFCKGNVIYNQTHQLIYCNCTAPVKMEFAQQELDRVWLPVGAGVTIWELLGEKRVTCLVKN